MTMTTTTTAVAESDQKKSASHAHVLPPWFEWFQDIFVLSFLIVAGAVLTGLMYTEGIVANPDNPNTWGGWGTVKFVAFFIAGAGVAGVALRASAAMAKAFRTPGFGSKLWGFVLLLISFMFMAIEVWANITERSKSHTFTPADAWVMQMIGNPNMPVSPTVIAIAFAQSIVLLVWGLVVGQKDIESDEDRAARYKREKADAEHQAELTAIKNKTRGTGLGSTIVGTIKTVQSGLSSSDTPTYPSDDTPTYEGSDSPIYGEENSPTYETSRDETRNGVTGIYALPKRGQWKRDDLIAYAFQKHGLTISPDDATDAMRTLSNGAKQGKNYVASPQTVRRWVDALAKQRQATAS